MKDEWLELFLSRGSPNFPMISVITSGSIRCMSLERCVWVPCRPVKVGRHLVMTDSTDLIFPKAYRTPNPAALSVCQEFRRISLNIVDGRGRRKGGDQFRKDLAKFKGLKEVLFRVWTN
jgi:hypothetical protein